MSWGYGADNGKLTSILFQSLKFLIDIDDNLEDVVRDCLSQFLFTCVMSQTAVNVSLLLSETFVYYGYEFG